jgi:MOSC domain-containing protein YiiM
VRGSQEHLSYRKKQMKIVSIQVGLPKEVEFRGKVVTTGIFKEPVKGPILVKLLNLSGDGQADLSVHGGPDKAV